MEAHGLRVRRPTIPRQRRFDSATLDRIRRQRANGTTLAEVAAEVSAPVSTVATVLRRGYRDTPLPDLPRERQGRPRRFDPDTVRLIARRRAEGYSLKEIATDLNSPVTTVQRAASDYQRDPRHEPIACPTCHRTL